METGLLLQNIGVWIAIIGVGILVISSLIAVIKFVIDMFGGGDHLFAVFLLSAFLFIIGYFLVMLGEAML